MPFTSVRPWKKREKDKQAKAQVEPGLITGPKHPHRTQIGGVVQHEVVSIKASRHRLYSPCDVEVIGWPAHADEAASDLGRSGRGFDGWLHTPHTQSLKAGAKTAGGDSGAERVLNSPFRCGLTEICGWKARTPWQAIVTMSSDSLSCWQGAL